MNGQFEYRVESHPASAGLQGATALIEVVNAVSLEEGWRLAHVVPSGAEILYIVERPVNRFLQGLDSQAV